MVSPSLASHPLVVMSETPAKKLKVLAERLFIEEGLSARAIAQDLGLCEKTLSRWRKGKAGEKSWDARRDEVMSAPHKIKEVLLKEMNNLAQGGESRIDADALSKVNKVLDSLTQGTSVGVIYSVFKEFDGWMASRDAQKAVELSEWHKKFLQYKASAP